MDPAADNNDMWIWMNSLLISDVRQYFFLTLTFELELDQSRAKGETWYSCLGSPEISLMPETAHHWTELLESQFLCSLSSYYSLLCHKALHPCMPPFATSQFLSLKYCARWLYSPLSDHNFNIMYILFVMCHFPLYCYIVNMLC